MTRGSRWPCVTPNPYPTRRVSPSERRRRQERVLGRRQEREVLAAFRAERLRLSRVGASPLVALASTQNTVRNTPTAAVAPRPPQRQFSCGDVLELAIQDIAEVLSGDDAKGKRCGAQQLFEAYLRWHQDTFLKKYPDQASDKLSKREFYVCLNQRFAHVKKSHSGKSVFAGIRLLK